MKLVLLAALLVPYFCFCQKNNDSLYFAAMGVYTFSNEYKPVNNATLPFNNLEVWDVREDTTSVGFIDLENAITQKLNYKNGLASEIKKFTENYYHFASANADTVNLIALIKTCRFTDLSDETDKKYDIKNYGLIFSAELFVFNGHGYHALYKVDTIIMIAVEHDLLSAIPSDIFKTLFEKAENKPLSSIHIGKTEFTFQQMHDHITSIYLHPVLTDSVIKEGVYLTFNDFKNNKPAFEDFIIKRGKDFSTLYKVNKGINYPLHNFWGYYNGNNFFLNDDNHFSLLVRSGNTFNTIAIKSIERKRRLVSLAGAQMALNTIRLGVPYFFPGNSSKNKIEKGAFQLDMQTGNLY